MTDTFRNRQLAFREREILAAARAALDDVGCRRLTMDMVAKRLGISKGTLYRHLASREELLRRVVGDGWEAVVEDVARANDRRPADRRLRQAARSLIRRFLALDPGSPCCLQEVECPFLDPTRLEAPVRGLPARGVGGLGLAATARVLAAAVRAHRGRRGEMPTEADARALLAFLVPDDR